MDFNQLVAEYQALKAQVDSLTQKVASLSGEADAKTDSVLVKIQKSSVSWLIVLGYTFGVFTLGAILF